MAASPFIKKFAIGSDYYIYDVSSNHILNVDKVIYSIINSHYCLINKRERSKHLNTKFTPKKAQKALREIHSFRRKGGFSDARPKGLKYHKPFDQLKRELQTRLQQLILNVTEDCNLRCKYCSYSGHYKYKRKHTPKRMPKDIAYRAINWFLPNTGKSKNVTIGFYGGEPFLNFEIIRDAVVYAQQKAKDKEVGFNATTNATILTDEILDFIVRNNIRLLVSLDGPKDIHDRYRVFRNGRGSFNVIKKNLEKIIAFSKEYYNSNISFNIVLSPPFKLLRVYNFIHKNEKLFKNTRISISSVDSQNTTFYNRFKKKDLKNNDYKKLEKIYFDNVTQGRARESVFLQKLMEDSLIKIYKRNIGSRISEYPYPNGVCVPGLRRIFVSVDGKFHICEKVTEYVPIGDVYNGLNYDKIQSIMKEYLEKSLEKCCKCWAVRLCSLCYVHTLTDKLDFKAKERNCHIEKKNIIYGLKLYCRILKQNSRALDYMEDITLS